MCLLLDVPSVRGEVHGYRREESRRHFLAVGFDKLLKSLKSIVLAGTTIDPILAGYIQHEIG